MNRRAVAVGALALAVGSAAAATAGADGYGTTTTTKPSTTTTTTTSSPTTSSTTTTSTTTTTCPDCVPNTNVQTTTTTSSTTTTTTPTTTSSPTTTTPSSTTSSTTSSPTTTTTLPETFTFGAAASVCVAEVPTIRITFQNQFPSLAGQTGTLTIADINGNVISTQSLVYQPGATVDLLYPGTSINADGSIDDVPGWTLTDDGLWIRDPSDEYLRDGIRLTYTVNPTATAFVTYPPESSACANPDGPFPPTPPPGRLPATR